MDDLSLDFDLSLPDPGGFDVEELTAGLTMDDFAGFGAAESTRYIRPAFDRGIPDRSVLYRHAAKFAEEIQFKPGERITAIVSGDFIFGDFLEAFMVHHNIHAKRMIVATLSYSQDNVDSLANLLEGDFVDQMDLITSVYFWGHERHRNGLIPYTYQKLDKDDRFQLAVCGSHCKYALIETHNGSKITIHGSANLRSSGCLEQVTIEEGTDIFDFLLQTSERILEAYKTIDKPVFRAKLWRAVNGEGAEEPRLEGAGGKFSIESGSGSKDRNSSRDASKQAQPEEGERAAKIGEKGGGAERSAAPEDRSKGGAKEFPSSGGEAQQRIQFLG